MCICFNRRYNYHFHIFHVNDEFHHSLNPELQLVLDDSERIRHALRDFRPVLDEISAVCDISTHEERLDQNDQQVQKMQCKILEPLEQLLQAVEVRVLKRGIPQISSCQVVSDPKWQWEETTRMFFFPYILVPTTSFVQRGFFFSDQI